MTDYNHLEFLLDDPIKLRLQSSREINPNYRNYSDTDLYYTLRKSGELEERFHNEGIDKAFGFHQKDKAERDDRTFKEKYEELGLFGRTIETIGDFVPDWKWAQRAYNKSLTGVTRHALMGEDKFKFDPDEDVGLIEDIVSSAASFLMPLDIITLGAGSKAGSLITSGGKRFLRYNGLNQMVQRRLGKKVTEAGLEGLSIPWKMASGAVKSSFPLASYEGAMGYTHALVNNQNPDNEHIDPWGAMGNGIIRGGILGAVIGGVSSGLLGRRAKIASGAEGEVTKETLSNLNWRDRAAWKLSSTPGLVATESAIFTVPTTVEKIVNGEDMRPGDVLHDFLKNVALFSTIKAQHKVLDKAFESASTIRNTMKKKEAEGSVDRALDEYRSKFEGDEVTKPFKDIINTLREKGFSDKEAIELIQKKSEGIMKDIVYIRNSLSKGEEYFQKDVDALYKINNLKDFIKELESDLRKVEFGDTVREKSVRKELEAQIEGLKELSGVYELKVTDPLAKRFEEYLSKDVVEEAKGMDSVRTEIVDRHKEMYPQSKTDPTVIYKGKKTSIMDPNVPLSVLKEKAESLKKLKIEKYGEESVDKEVDALLDIKSDKEFREPKTESGEPILKPGKQRYEDRPAMADIIKAIKNPFKKTLKKARDSFERSARWITSMVQNKYATGIAHRTNEPYTVKTTKERTSVLKKFAKFLADRKKDFTTMTEADLTEYSARAPESHKVAVSDLIKYMKSIEAGAPGTIHRSLVKVDSDKVYELFKTKEVDVSEKKERVGLREKHVDLSKKDGEISRVTSKGGDTKVTPITNQLKNSLKRMLKTFEKQISLEKLKTGLSSPLFRSRKSKESDGTKSEGRVLEIIDVNHIIAKLTGSWKKDGSGRKSAVAIRSALITWAKGRRKKYFGEEVDVTDFVNIVGLGHGNKADLVQIYTKYGKNKSKMIYREIIKDFYKELKNYKKIKKEGGDIVEEESYNMVEVGKALEKVLNLKEGETIKVEVKDSPTPKERQEGKKEGKLVRKIEIDKDTAEGLMRMLIENPSRLNEIAVVKVDKIEQQKIEKEKAYEEINEKKEQAEIDSKNQEKNNEHENLSEYEKVKYEAERAKIKLEAEKKKKEWQDSEEYKERERINREIKSKDGPEKELSELAPQEVRIPKSKGAKKDRYLNKVVRDIRLKIFGHTDYKYTNKDNGPNKTDLGLYKEALEQAIKDIKNPKGIEKELENKGISDSQKVEIAQLLGRADGNISLLTPGGKRLLRQITKDIELLENSFTKPEDAEYQDQSKVWGLKNKIKANRAVYMRTWLLIQKAAENTMGSAKKYLATIENLTSRLDVYNETYRGITNIEYNQIASVLKAGGKKEAMKDIGWMDPAIIKGLEAQLKNKKLSTSEREAYDKLYKKLKPHYDASLMSGTAENVALILWGRSRDRIWKEFKHSVLDANKNIGPAKLKKLEKVLKDMFEKNYLPSFVRKEVRDNYQDSKEYQEIKDEVYFEILEKKAMKKTDDKLGKKLKMPRDIELREKLLNPQYRAKYNENLKNLKESDSGLAVGARRDARNEAAARITDGIENAEVHTKSRSFMERTVKLPMFITISKNGKTKLVRTYESGMYNTLNSYYISSARYLAVAKAAPEMLGSKFFKGKGGDLKTALERLDVLLGSKNKGLSNYLNDTVSELIGTKESNSYKLIADIANFSAVSGLSAFATPGIKNLVLGQTQIFTTFSGMEHFKEMAKLMLKRGHFKESMERATKTGAAQYTQRELGFGKDIMKTAGDKIYKFSLMTQAENINRMLAINVGENFAHRQFEVLSSKTSTSNQKLEAERFLRDTLRFTEKEVSFISKNKHNDLSNPENLKEFNYLMDKVHVYSHKSTQGGVSTLDVPKWMSQGNKKDFLLFQRIATSVTGHVNSSVVKPALRGNFMPLIKYGVANYLGGALSYSIYKALYDDDTPKSLGSEYDKALMYLWRNEAFGTWGLILDNLPVNLNPYYNGVSSGDIVKNLTPVIARNSKDFFAATVSAIGGYKTPGQATHDFLKSTISLYGQIDKTISRQGFGDKSEDFKEGKNAINYKRQYRQFLGEEKANFLNIEGSRNQPYYRDLRAVIHWGTDEEIAKYYYLAVNHAYDNFLNKPGATKVGAFNKAHGAVMSSILQMNPTFSTTTRDKKSTERKEYLNWLQAQDRKIRKRGGTSNAYKTTLKVEKRFKKTVGKIKRIRGNQDLINKYSNIPELNFNKTSGRNKNRSPQYRDYKYLDAEKRHPSYYELRQMEILEEYGDDYLY